MALTKITSQMFDTSAAGHDFNIDNGTFVVDASANRVGIGTTSPSLKFHSSETGGSTIAGLFQTNQTDSYISFQASGTTDNSTVRIGAVGDALRAFVNGAFRFAITSAGNVGIGTVSPAEAFTIKGDGHRMTIESADYENVMIGRRGSSGVDLDKGYLRMKAAGVNKVILDTAGDSYLMGGNVGIGSTSAPPEKLHVYTTGNSRVEVESTTGVAAFKATNNSGSYAWYVDNTADKFHLYDFTDNAQRVTIDGSGNVGIGTSSVTSNVGWNKFLLVDGGTSNAVIVGGTDGQQANIGAVDGFYIDVYGHSTATNNNIIFRTQNANSVSAGSERMRIDSSGNTTFKTSAGHLSVEALGGGSVKLNSNGSMGMNVASGFNYEIDVGGTEAMRIDSSRKLLVGKSSSNYASEGIELRPNEVLITKNGLNPLSVRGSGNGSYISINSSGTTVGSIGSFAGVRPYFSSPNTGISPYNQVIYPVDGSGNATNGVTDIGHSSYRFKDLYLSGGAYLGGTAAANKLDDYEEGTWTPGVTGTGNSLGGGAAVGRYTKVGRMVYLQLFINNDGSNTFGSGAYDITGLPFTAVNSSAQVIPAMAMVRYVTPPSGAFQLNTYTPANQTKLQFYWSDTSNWEQLIGTHITSTNFAMYAGVVYEAA